MYHCSSHDSAVHRAEVPICRKSPCFRYTSAEWLGSPSAKARVQSRSELDFSIEGTVCTQQANDIAIPTVNIERIETSTAIDHGRNLADTRIFVFCAGLNL